MMPTATAPAFTPEGFAAFLAARQGEPAWFTDLRRAAWTTYESLPWPGARDEEWMRTDIRLFKLNKFALATETVAAAELPPALLAQGVALAGSAHAINGTSAGAQLEEKWRARGVLFGSLEELLAEHGERIRPHLLTRAVRPQIDRFAALHAAVMSGSFLLYVPRGVVIDQPLHCLSALAAGASDCSHTLVVLEEGAEATLLSETASYGENDAGFHCGAIELIVGPGAKLRYVNLQNWGRGVWHFAHQKAIVEREGSLQWTIGAMGSRLAKVNQHVALAGAGAECQVNGVMFTEDKQHLSYHTLQHHEAPNTRSDLLYKGALQDQARVVWRGMIKVDPLAQKTDGYQRNDNLMLSAHARADSIPGLEIEADDVRCTHGSTSGRVDEELIFYAQSRGLRRREAIRLVVSGFFQQIFDRITIESVREALGAAIGRRVREYL